MSRGLGQIQRAIVARFDDGFHPGPEVRRWVATPELVALIYGEDTPAARAGICRALRGLRERGLVRADDNSFRQRTRGRPVLWFKLTKRGTKLFGLRYGEHSP